MLQRCSRSGNALALGGRRVAWRRPATPSLNANLQRELHKMPPPATLPPPETLACYERLGKIAQFTPLPIQSEPAQCATVDLVRLDRVTDARPDRGCGQSAADAPVQHGGGGGGVRPRRCRARRGRARRAACRDHRRRFLFDCRGRNNIRGAKLSEHGKGNALDISAIKLATAAPSS